MSLKPTARKAFTSGLAEKRPGAVFVEDRLSADIFLEAKIHLV